MMSQPTVTTCEPCNGAGCGKCVGKGKTWSDGVKMRDALCTEGQQCGRFVQCATCPYVEELTAWKGMIPQPDGR